MRSKNRQNICVLKYQKKAGPGRFWSVKVCSFELNVTTGSRQCDKEMELNVLNLKLGCVQLRFQLYSTDDRPLSGRRERLILEHGKLLELLDYATQPLMLNCSTSKELVHCTLINVKPPTTLQAHKLLKHQLVSIISL